MKRVAGVFFLVVFLALAFMTYWIAGGMHGEFDVGKLGRQEAPITLGGAAVTLVLGLLLLLGKKKAPKA
jgi:hypothetical protein